MGSKKSGRTLILCGASGQPARLIHRAEFERRVGSKNICKNMSEALERAKQLFFEIEQNHSKKT